MNILKELDDLADQDGVTSNESEPGKYIGVRFSQETVDNLVQYCQDTGIPNPLAPEKFHSTVLYSRKPLPDLEAIGDYEVPMYGTLTEFDVWQSTPDEGEPTNCLVLKYDCTELSDRHNELSEMYNVPFDFEGGYKPHVTFSYDIGDFSIDELEVPNFKIEIVHEYEEELNTNWANDEG